MGCSPPDSSVHGIIQARILERVAISFYKGPSPPRDHTCISCTGRQILYDCTTWEAPIYTIICHKLTLSCSLIIHILTLSLSPPPSTHRHRHRHTHTHTHTNRAEALREREKIASLILSTQRLIFGWPMAKPTGTSARGSRPLPDFTEEPKLRGSQPSRFQSISNLVNLWASFPHERWGITLPSSQVSSPLSLADRADQGKSLV